MKQVRKNKYVFFLVVGLFIFTACEKNKLNDDTLVKIYVENLIIEESYSATPDALKQKKLELFKKYNTSAQQYESALLTLKDDKKRWSGFFKKADAQLEELKKKGVIK